jgi:acyl carrier protein
MDQTQIITRFIVEEFLPDLTVADLAPDYDLLAGGVIDSLGLLKVIAWLEERYQVDVEQVELAPESFRSVDAIREFLDHTRVGVAGHG